MTLAQYAAFLLHLYPLCQSIIVSFALCFHVRTLAWWVIHLSCEAVNKMPSFMIAPAHQRLTYAVPHSSDCTAVRD